MANPTTPALPQCRIVTGLPGTGKTRWLREKITPLVLSATPARVGVLQLEQGRTRLDPHRLGWPEIQSRIALSPCLCCPPPLDLAALATEWMAPPGLDWLFIEVPAIAFANWLADFDRFFGCPRRIIVCPGRPPRSAGPSSPPSYFLSQLLAYADEVVPPPTDLSPAPATLTL